MVLTLYGNLQRHSIIGLAFKVWFSSARMIVYPLLKKKSRRLNVDSTNILKRLFVEARNKRGWYKKSAPKKEHFGEILFGFKIEMG